MSRKWMWSVVVDDRAVALQPVVAQGECKDIISRGLQQPSTADFVFTRASGSNPWRMTAYVEADNGAYSRVWTTWTCRVTIEDGIYGGTAVLG